MTTKPHVEFLFHGTSLDAARKIRVEGLVPQPPPDFCWPEYDDLLTEDDDAPVPPEAREPRVFASETFSGARSYAENNERPIVLRIVVSDGIDWDFGATDFPYRYTTQTVPPDFIQFWNGSVWQPINRLAD